MNLQRRQRFLAGTTLSHNLQIRLRGYQFAYPGANQLVVIRDY